jgi:hypothetical protein
MDSTPLSKEACSKEDKAEEVNEHLLSLSQPNLANQDRWH